MRRNISIFILLGFAVTVFAFGLSNDDNPNQRNRTTVANKQKNIDAGITYPQQDFIGPIQNLPQSVINESFEGSYLPAGWSKLNPDGGTGWEQATNGTTPLPGGGWVGGTITVPPGGGDKVAFCTWTTGGAVSNDQWLVTPQLTNIGSNDSLKFWLRYWPDSYRDSIEVWISTTTPTVANFTTLVFRKDFAEASGDTNWTEYKFKIGGLVPNGSNIYIGFREVVADNFVDGASFSLDLVSTTGVTNFVNDMAATSINSPAGNIALPVPTIAPKATFSNVGSANQTNVPVTLEIRNNANALVYSSNKTVSVNAGNSAQVIFDSTFNPAAGTYNIKAISKLASDQNLANDTAKSTINVVNVNYGGNDGYNFANSTSGASDAPSKPLFCWKDTTGSTSLVVNGIASVPVSTGDLDDGYWKIYLGGKKIRFYGNNIDTVRIGTNGIIGFQEFAPGGGNWNPPTAGIPGGTVSNAFFPFWRDFDFRATATTISPTFRLSYRIEENQLIITYDRAPVWGAAAGNYVSFQSVIDLAASPTTNSKLAVQYADTTNTNTGQPFVNALTGNTLSTHLVGLQNSAATLATTYRFRNSSVVVTGGPLLDNPLGNLAVRFGPNASLLGNSCGAVLNLTFRLEAIQVTKRDTVTVELRSSAPGRALIESYKVYYNIPSGSATIPLKFAESGKSYYIFVSHRNSITTSSASPVLLSGNTMTYDFTTNVNKAYGSNMVVIGGKASFYTGDVTRDGCSDAGDVAAVDNDAFNFVGGPYVITDLNFDGSVDVTDLVYVENNSFNFVCQNLP